MLILDSNTISYYFRGDPQVVPRLQALSPVDIGVPAIVEYELRYGLLRLPPETASHDWRRWRRLWPHVVPFEGECAASAAAVACRSGGQRTPIGPQTS